MTETTPAAPLHPELTLAVLGEVHRERAAQDARWGEQNHPDGTGGLAAQRAANEARRLCQDMAVLGDVTWRDILDEEVREAFAETDPAKLRAELVQVGAVAVEWAEHIDRRRSEATPEAATQPLADDPAPARGAGTTEPSPYATGGVVATGDGRRFELPDLTGCEYPVLPGTSKPRSWAALGGSQVGKLQAEPVQGAAELREAIEAALEQHYAGWPDTAVTSEHEAASYVVEEVLREHGVDPARYRAELDRLRARLGGARAARDHVKGLLAEERDELRLTRNDCAATHAALRDERARADKAVALAADLLGETTPAGCEPLEWLVPYFARLAELRTATEEDPSAGLLRPLVSQDQHDDQHNDGDDHEAASAGEQQMPRPESTHGGHRTGTTQPADSDGAQ